MESYIAGGVESVLLDELKFTPSPGASYILNKSQVRYFPSGSSIYSPTSGQRVCKINITGPSNQWLNPQSLRLCFDVINTAPVGPNDAHGAPTAGLPLRMLTGGWGFWRRLDVRMGGVQVESIANMNRVQELMTQLSSFKTRNKEVMMSGGSMSDELHGNHATTQHQNMLNVVQGTARNVSIPLISGLCAQNKFLWPNAAPIEFTWELDDAGANLWLPTAGTEANNYTDQFQIQNVYLIADAVEMDAGLLNKYVQHLAQGYSLSWEIKSLNSVLHSVGNSHASFSCNQSRAYTKLDSVFATLVRTEDAGQTLQACKKPVNWFQGLSAEHLTAIIPDNSNDILESYITLGSKRIPVFPENRVNMHYFRLLQACGKNASDVHHVSMSRDAYLSRSFCLGYDLEKLPPGTLASFSGENTRSGDLLGLYLKNLTAAVDSVQVVCQFMEIIRLSGSGVDVLD